MSAAVCGADSSAVTGSTSIPAGQNRQDADQQHPGRKRVICTAKERHGVHHQPEVRPVLLLGPLSGGDPAAEGAGPARRYSPWHCQVVQGE